MKNLIPVLAVLAVLMAFTACEVEETYSVHEREETYSVHERMEAFIDDANAKSWSDLKAHTHPSAAMYDEADATFWTNYFSTSVPLDDLTTSGQTARCTGLGGEVYDFYLTADGDDDNLIIRIERGQDTIFE